MGILILFSLLVALLFNTTHFAHGEALKYKHPLNANERRCLSQLVRAGEWRYSADLRQSIMRAAYVVMVDLNGDGQEEYIFIVPEFSFCGTAGCSMSIARVDKRGVCHEIYSGKGSETGITVLAKRDHGYRRLYTPCEVRFDGRQYQQVREECPNAVIHR